LSGAGRRGVRALLVRPRGILAIVVRRAAGSALFAALAAAPAAAGSAAVYDFVPEKSEILVRTGRSGLLRFAGHRHVIRAESFEGILVLADEPESSRVSLAIETASLRVADKDLDAGDVAKVQTDMEEKVLEVASHPRIEFVSTSVAPGEEDALEITGTLTLHGVAREIRFPAALSLESDRVLLQGELEIRQKDFEIEPVSIGLGAVKVSNEVAISFEIVGAPRAPDAE
jgi:polyisoprenoid-binding protein YceI